MIFRTPTAAARCTTRSTWSTVSLIIGWFRMESTIRWERGVVTDLGEVVQAARGQVVDHEDRLSGLEQALHQV